MEDQVEKPSRPAPAPGKKNKEKKKEGQENVKVQGKGDAKKQPPLPPPPEEVVMKVGMHCEGCVRTVLRSLKDFEGVENVIADCRTQKVVVKGRKAAEDPLKVVERVKKKSGRKVELLSPLPPPPPPPELEKKEENKKIVDELKDRRIIVVLKVQMHCKACAEEIRKIILKFKSVETAVPDLKNSTVMVTGVLESSSLASYVQKKTGKQTEVAKQGPKKPQPMKKEDSSGKEESPSSGKEEKITEKEEVQASERKEKDKKKKKKKVETDNVVGTGEGNRKKGATDSPATEEGNTKINEDEYYSYNYKYNQSYSVEYRDNSPLIFGDENPNACLVM